MARRMKPCGPLELNQFFEWFMPPRRPTSSYLCRLRREPPRRWRPAPRDSHYFELALVESDAARYQRFSGVAISHHGATLK
jgi:hypothetical protein